MSGILYIVATPIGNLEDITLRAIRILKEADWIAVEDTRVARKLFNKYEISCQTIVYHDHNEMQVTDKIIHKLNNGENIALISDAGTPAISDPGFRLTREAKKHELKIEVVPGPSSVTSALSVSGLPTDHFFFEGFLPRKKGRKTRFDFLNSLDSSVVIFESPMRIRKTLKDIAEKMGNRVVSISRELTKLYEETYTGSIQQAIEHFDKKTPKGEFVIIVAKEGFEL